MYIDTHTKKIYDDEEEEKLDKGRSEGWKNS